MNCETTDVCLALLASPEPYIDESPASWIQYICAEHQYSLARLALILGFKPVDKDWDLGVSSAQWEIVQKMSGATSSACAEAREKLSQFLDGGKMMAGNPKSKKLSAYQWCSHCFAEDRRPYLRWWWRVGIGGHCPKHATPLSRRCECCGDPFRLSRALMVSGGACRPVPDLSHCLGCGMLLGGMSETLNMDPAGEHLKTRLSPESDEKIVGVPPRNALSANASEPSRYGHEIFLSTPDSVCTAIGKRRHPDRFVLNLTSAAFQAVAEGGPCKTQNPPWSHQIPRSFTRSRQKLAYALRLIRQEKRLTGADDPEAVGKREEEDRHA